LRRKNNQPPHIICSFPFFQVEVRYRETAEPALKGISFHVNPKEKVGIVGRTGSGKTTLAMTLFRIVEISRGTITIDGYDISKIGN
jgi:ABC-type multidrug transport system fused ATPase/permease subunit